MNKLVDYRGMGKIVFALNEGTFREIREGVISFAKQSVLWVMIGV